MIEVDGGKITLSGSEATLRHEFAFLIGMLQSRMNSRGVRAEGRWQIEDAVADAKLYTVEYLRSKSRMCAGAERLSGRMMV